ncbi:hypothetical protein IAQ61_009046 [Plenodomus lingam]|uniref:uncharacterized protein n=1 Tax=Leptosphaeria maculans TaxID=5022 RepID=UPI00331B0255|nr:hypothetical protein IAQ61_009046 [Plenodomus lingam]
MCYFVYTLYKCSHWIPQPNPADGLYLRLCKEAETLRLGRPCPDTIRDHRVETVSQGMCKQCMWEKVSY